MADEVLTSREGAVLTVTLNRPEVYNAFNRALHDALGEALTEAQDPAVRCVVVTGAGKGFCAGQVGEVRCAVLYEKPRSIVQCEYVWRRTDLWIDFPWSAEAPVTRGRLPAVTS